MPTRPKSHQIEDRSRAKFRLTLPDEWVFRDITPDYGIDGEVEIFDKNGKSTGLSFLVQLKSSESESIIRRRRVILRKDQWYYYEKKDVPVLIVKYDKVENSFFYRWAGTVHPFCSKRETRSFSFKFLDSEKWNEYTYIEIQKDLVRFRRLTSGSLVFPIYIKLFFEAGLNTLVPISVLRSKVRVAFDAAGANLSLAGDEAQDYDVVLHVHKDGITVLIGGYIGMILHRQKALQDETFIFAFPRLVIEGIVLALGHFGQFGLASSLILASQSVMAIDTHPEIAATLASYLLRAGHFESALDFANRVFATQENEVYEFAFRLDAMKTARHMSEKEQLKLENYLLGRLQQKIARGTASQIGVAHYNLGNHLKIVKKFRLALHHYKMAGRSAQFYRNQRYYLEELGSVLFGIGRYNMAVGFYQRALAIEYSDRTSAFCADALMFSGRYDEALQQFEVYLSSIYDPNPEWLLKTHILFLLTKVTGVKMQKRRISEAIASVRCDEETSVEEHLKFFNRAIELDILCPVAWFNFGVISSGAAEEFDHGKWHDAVMAFLIAALVRPNDIEAWSNAVICAFNYKDDWIHLPRMIMCAYFYNGSRFLTELNDHVLRDAKMDVAAEMIELFEKMALEAKFRDEIAITVRMVDDNGFVETWRAEPV